MASPMATPHPVPYSTFNGRVTGLMPSGVQNGYPVQAPVALQGSVISGPVVNGTISPTATTNPTIQAFQIPVVPVGGGCYNDGMEVVWHGEFSRLFSSFFPPHVWYLSITSSSPPEKWKFFRDSAKVRFCCHDCGNGWTSMKGRVSFWFYLNHATNEGFVQFKLYGQVCKKCNTGKFEYVMWYPEEVSKVMCNLYHKIGQTFYGFLQPPIRIDRRPGRPRNQHNADLCQACRDGECDQGRPVKAIYNYIPPGMDPTAAGQLPIFNGTPNQIPVVIRQPPTPHPRHVMIQTTMNPYAPSSAVAPHCAPSFITAPVSLKPGARPILTYSVVTTSTKDTPKLASGSEKNDDEPIDVSKSREQSSDEGIPSLADEKMTSTQTETKAKKSFAVAIKAPPSEKDEMQHNDLQEHKVSAVNTRKLDAVDTKTPEIAESLSNLKISPPDVTATPKTKDPTEAPKMHICQEHPIKEFKPKEKGQQNPCLG